MSQTVFPLFSYRDPDAAIAFLERAFGFEQVAVHRDPDGAVQHAELRFGDSIVMLGGVREGNPAQPGATAVYVAVEDPDAHHARAVAAGAEIVMPLRDLDYGSRDYGARDPEGNSWAFGTYAPASVASG